MIDAKERKIIIKNIVEGLTEYGEQKGIDFSQMSKEEFEKEFVEWVKHGRRSH